MAVLRILDLSLIATLLMTTVSSQTVNTTLPERVVTTKNGAVRGVQYVRNQVNLMKFLGIPYAHPPVGQRRFKPPEPASNWTGVRDATKLGNECIQTIEPFITPVRGLPLDEDCLFLSVYAPATSMSGNSTALPVMVWIHGGGYRLGAGSQYDGSDLAAKGVVVVTLNYRLGVMGFLSTETDEMPGNYGMLDQVFALQWVEDNIAVFGGDPAQVTIFGESAGSASVSLLSLSPTSKGLFKRAIMESGSSLSPWAIYHPTNHVSPSLLTRLVGDSVGCSDFDPSALLTCLQNVDAFALHNASERVRKTITSADYGILLAPRVENVYNFLPDLPIRLLSQGQFEKIDTLRGFNLEEAGGNVPDPKDEGYTLKAFKDIVNKEFLEHYAFADYDHFLQEIIDLYVHNNTNPFFIRGQAIRAVSDILFNGPVVNELNLVLSSAPTSKHYLYEFNYRPSYSFLAPWQGTVHADEVAFVFGVTNDVYVNFGIQANADDQGVSEQVVTMWTNFAKIGDPTSSVPTGATAWTTYSSSNHECLNIDTHSKPMAYDKPDIINLNNKIIQKLDTSFPSSGTIIG